MPRRATTSTSIPCSMGGGVTWRDPCTKDVKGNSIRVTGIDADCSSRVVHRSSPQPYVRYAGTTSGPSGPGRVVTTTPVVSTPFPCCVNWTLFDVDLSSYFDFLKDGMKKAIDAIPILNSDAIDLTVEVKGKGELCCVNDEQDYGVEASASVKAEASLLPWNIRKTGETPEITLDSALKVGLNAKGSFFVGLDLIIEGELKGDYKKGCGNDGCASANGSIELTATGGVQVTGEAFSYRWPRGRLSVPRWLWPAGQREGGNWRRAYRKHWCQRYAGV